MSDFDVFLEILEETMKNKGGFPKELSEETAEWIFGELAENCNAHFCEGVSKAAIVFDNDDCVIKIPFNGRYFWNCGGNEYIDEFLPFCGAYVPDDDCNWDYCLREEWEYKRAESAGVAAYFAETAFLKHICGYPIYIQPKVKTYSEIGYTPDGKAHNSLEELSKTTKYCHEKGYRCFADDWLTDFRTYYGDIELNKLLSFLDDECIGDLHSENIGYLGNRPIILDYSDYNE